MTEKEKLQEALIEALSKKSEASYSRIYQHTQDDSTFAIIGSEDIFYCKILKKIEAQNYIILLETIHIRVVNQ